MSRLPLQLILDRHAMLESKLTENTDPKELIKISKEYKLADVQYSFAKQILEAEKIIKENNKELSNTSDTELKEMLIEEINSKTVIIQGIESQLLSLLSPSDPRDSDNVLLEIRAGAGGDEAALFVGDLYKMYALYAQSLGYKASIVSASNGTMGGFKDVVAEIRGEGAFRAYKYESGVHRVQRVPDTEKQGRIHTSTVTVALMPLVESSDEFVLPENEIEIIISTSSGNGGQSVNTTYSAVRMKHIPTGMEAQSQDERDQAQNKVKALRVLTSRVAAFYEEKRKAEEDATRKGQVGTGDRSEKIRTYNFPQDRLTDHRYTQNWNQLPLIMQGGIDRVIKDIQALEAEKVIAELNV
jgi:peptide chain release factor 1